ncbi:MAG: VWA domain-containing protein [Anaerolineales bacterium]|jgi:hypothetical protein
MSKHTRSKGQAMVLIALAFVGLAAFIGLTVDAGILFIQIGHLRRAVDSASLAAANQFREGRTVAEMEAMADEFIDLNSLNPADAEIFICDLDNPTAGNTNSFHDLDLCPEDLNGNGWRGPYRPPSGGVPADDAEVPRKFLRVEATMPVEFTFLPIVGFGSVDIHAEAVSEAASIDLVLVIDVSESMAYDAECGDGEDDDAWAEKYLMPGSPPTYNPSKGGSPDGLDDCSTTSSGVRGDWPDDIMRDPDICNDADNNFANGIDGQCHPFEEVRDAALSLVGQMNFPYDRMAVVKFDREAPDPPPSDLTSNDVAISSAITGMTVFKLPGCPSDPPDPGPCTSTNIADGLTVAGNQFGTFFREEAVPIVILLSDGAANAARDSAGTPICPIETRVYPLCHDAWFEEGPGMFGPDAEDYAVEAGYFVGCPEGISFPTATTTCSAPGQGAVVFTIGLGNKVTDDDKCDTAFYGTCEEDQGEKLLRFIAAIGDDGNPATNPCKDSSGNWLPKGTSCGNYYYSPTGSQLLPVFEAIASRIFTRITH